MTPSSSTLFVGGSDERGRWICGSTTRKGLLSLNSRFSNRTVTVM